MECNKKENWVIQCQAARGPTKKYREPNPPNEWFLSLFFSLLKELSYHIAITQVNCHFKNWLQNTDSIQKILLKDEIVVCYEDPWRWPNGQGRTERIFRQLLMISKNLKVFFEGNAMQPTMESTRRRSFSSAICCMLCTVLKFLITFFSLN